MSIIKYHRMCSSKYSMFHCGIRLLERSSPFGPREEVRLRIVDVLLIGEDISKTFLSVEKHSFWTSLNCFCYPTSNSVGSVTDIVSVQLVVNLGNKGYNMQEFLLRFILQPLESWCNAINIPGYCRYLLVFGFRWNWVGIKLALFVQNVHWWLEGPVFCPWKVWAFQSMVKAM